MTVNISKSSEGIQYISVISDFHQPCILNAAGRRAKRTKILALGSKYLMYAGSFLPLSVPSQSEVNVYIFDFVDFQELCMLKTAGRRVKWTKM